MVDWKKYSISLAVAALIFLAGIGLGQIIVKQQVGDLLATENELREYTIALELQSRLLEDDICSVDILKATADKTALGKRLDSLEKQAGKKSKDVFRLKNTYSLLSIQQYLLLQLQNENCGAKKDLILYFYNNLKDMETSRTQGYILDYVYEQRANSTVVYAFDININNPATATLKQKHNITEAPAIVINDLTVLRGLQTSDEIFKAIDAAHADS